MADIDDGGPAFPGVLRGTYGGMTLRDWFAGQALCGWVSDPAIDSNQEEGVARICYALADAMIQARKPPA